MILAMIGIALVKLNAVPELLEDPLLLVWHEAPSLIEHMFFKRNGKSLRGKKARQKKQERNLC